MKPHWVDVGSPVEVRQIGWEGDTQITRWVPAKVICVFPNSLQVQLEGGGLMAFMWSSPRWRPATA